MKTTDLPIGIFLCLFLSFFASLFHFFFGATGEKEQTCIVALLSYSYSHVGGLFFSFFFIIFVFLFLFLFFFSLAPFSPG